MIRQTLTGKIAETIDNQKRVNKEHPAHCDFCEQCAMYEQGDAPAPCDTGRALWEAFYGQPFCE